ncbi:hypothetical protein [Marixanthomonas ophiurae]|uniref:Curlin associated repeat-containing protein n=1 Tax=Marixanthomonas ophiurae TaxID=387659 RepID=A0A3E1QCS7_9FLAO|nr:hypothetical protein [Marixanthomonas ophiurae]RFN59959.1 hypothetical protein DZ858_07900 [Marixanthomonas ophiurae]
MKNLTKILFVLVFSFFSIATAFSQTYSKENQNAIENLQNKAVQLNYISSQQSQINATRSTVATANNVFVQQVGNYNRIVSNTKSDRSDINLFQNGNNNDIFLKINAGTINEKVVQNGNNHSFIDFSPLRSNVHEGQILQTGNGQNLRWYGSNSLSEKLKVSMKGNGQTLTIRNFN